jgi:hypothetical protein
VLLNQSALDVLYYHDPRCCQRIIDEMCKNMSAMYALFLERHPGFEDKGGKVLYTCAMKCQPLFLWRTSNAMAAEVCRFGSMASSCAVTYPNTVLALAHSILAFPTYRKYNRHPIPPHLMGAPA